MKPGVYWNLEVRAEWEIHPSEHDRVRLQVNIRLQWESGPRLGTTVIVGEPEEFMLN